MESYQFCKSGRLFPEKIVTAPQSRTVSLKRDECGFGFTLRHFIVYPPTNLTSQNLTAKENVSTSIQLPEWKPDGSSRPMDTIFIREVKQGSSAHKAGLVEGDRIIAINNHPLMGKTYSDIINLILESGIILQLLVVPKEDDILQLYFASSAYQPVTREQNQDCNDEMNHLKPYEGCRKYLVKKFTDDNHLPHHQPVSNEVKTFEEETIFAKGEKLVKNAPCCVSSDAEINILKHYSIPNPNFPDLFLHANNGTSQREASSLLPIQSDCNHELKESCFVTIANYDYLVGEGSLEFIKKTGSIEKKPDYNFDSLKFNNVGENNSCISSENWDSSTSDPVLDLPVETSPQMLCSVDSGLEQYSGFLSSDNNQLQISRECESNMQANDINEINYDDNNCSDASSINIVAQRCHQFESGNLLAESLEKMKMYKSELSRMTKPKQTHIVSARAAHFENMSAPLQHMSESLAQESCIQSDALSGQNVSYVKTETFTEETIANKKNSSDSNMLSTVNKSEFNTFSHNFQMNSFRPSLDSLDIPESTAVSLNGNQGTHPVQAEVVFRRKPIDDNCHLTRRISYLRATAEDRMLGDGEQTDDEQSECPTSQTEDHHIRKLKTLFGEKTTRLKHGLQPEFLPEDFTSCVLASDISNSVYGWLICKVVSLEGKRSSDRSWRHVWAILRDNILYLLRERREPSNGSLTTDDHVINVKNSITKIADDYLKRKNVLRLMLLNGTEYLVQAENHTNMMEWLQALQAFSAGITKMPNWTRDNSVLEKAIAFEQQIQINKTMSVLHQSYHPVRKLVFRHRSPSEQVLKARRASQGDEMALSKIGVMWRDRVMHGWKKVHGTVVHDSSKEASFGVRLEYVPSAVSNEHVPLLVELCVQIVENHGLDMVGIYRVPGNNASVSTLTHTINQGLDDVALQDTRWNDVNVVSSLLKAFFRKLPEPLLTSQLYPQFILASKIEDPLKRLTTLKNMLQQLPVHHFETLKYLMCHLKKVVEHSNINKMEARNLAIVFGPTLVRAADNSMIAMVTDMSHQCYLIETMITYADWLFEESQDTMPYGINMKDKRKTHPASATQSSTLIDNIYEFDKSHEEFLKDILPHEVQSSLQSSVFPNLRHRTKNKSRNSKVKRSGIIEQTIDCDMLNNQLANKDASLVSSAQKDYGVSSVQIEPFSDIIDSCNSLACESITSKPRSPRNSAVKCLQYPNSHSCFHRDTILGTSNADDEIVVHTYDELSALAQQKVKNFEKETKALLKRDISKAQAPAKSGHVEWEQIEREWQKAKLELEEEDLLDHLADDPSFLSLLLNRRADIHSEGNFPEGCETSQNIYLMDFENSNVKPRVFSNHSAFKKIESSLSLMSEKAEKQHHQLIEKEDRLIGLPEANSTLVKNTNIIIHPNLSSETSSCTSDVTLSDANWIFLGKEECDEDTLSRNSLKSVSNIRSQIMQPTLSEPVPTDVSYIPDQTETLEMATVQETLDMAVLCQSYCSNSDKPSHANLTLGPS